MGEQHLDLLALAPRGDPLVFLRERPRHVAGPFMDRAHDLARIGAGTAPGLERTGVAIELAGAVAVEAVGMRGSIICRAAPAEALELLACRADITILLAVEGEGRPVER